MKKIEFSKNPMDFVYAAIWLFVFSGIAIQIASGKFTEPNAQGRVNFLSVVVRGITDAITPIGAGIIVFLIGLYVAYWAATDQKKAEKE